MTEPGYLEFTAESNALDYLEKTIFFLKSTTQLFNVTFNYGTGNNDQLQSVADNLDNTRSTNYTYDAWARLKTATAGPAATPTWSLSWTYDRYGNRTAQTVTAGTAPSNSVTIDSTSNRLSGYTYDANGNLTVEPMTPLAPNNYSYDGENRLVSFQGGSSSATYSYDGNSLRVQKVSGGTTTVYIFSGTKVIAEYENGVLPAAPTREYIYSGSQPLATLEGGVAKYYVRDHLSVRAITDQAANLIGQQGHFPYGESWYQTGVTAKWRFTSYERDAESGNDYAIARYHINRLARFSSPDPIAGSPADPQSLNRYAYVRDDPSNLVDPSGQIILPRTDTCSVGGGTVGATAPFFGGAPGWSWSSVLVAGLVRAAEGRGVCRTVECCERQLRECRNDADAQLSPCKWGTRWQYEFCVANCEKSRGIDRWSCRLGCQVQRGINRSACTIGWAGKVQFCGYKFVVCMSGVDPTSYPLPHP